MKLRMYLRGLGIGIVVTAIIMAFAPNNGNKKMTDAEIMARARELGMVEESTTLAEAVKKDDNKENKIEQSEKAIEETKTEAKEEINEESKAEVKEDKVEESKAEVKEDKVEESKAEVKEDKKGEEKPEVREDKKEEKPEAKEEIIEDTKPEAKEDKKEEIKAENKEEMKPVTSSTSITITGGCSSDTVAKLLEKGGVIDSASKFDDYLCKNGYDHKITTGKHEIPSGADYETIAKIITSGNR